MNNKNELKKRYKDIKYWDKKRWESQNLKSNFIPQIKFVKLKRKCEYWRERNRIIFYCFRFRYERYKIKYNTDIPASVKIGKGFKVRHLGGIVINPKAKIGEFVDILNGVMIGAEDRGKRKGAPRIGNNVFIGANAIIVGKVIIEDNVLIAPGAYVNFDVPANSIVIGNPGAIKHNIKATEGYIYN